MREIGLKYGKTLIPLMYDEARFDVLSNDAAHRALSDVELGDKLDVPIGSKPLEEIVNPGETVLFVVPDATRKSAAGQVVNLLVRRLIANGTTPHEMTVIFATGIHRPVTAEEKHEILTPFIAQRVKTLDHNPRDLMQLVRVGETATGTPVELNRALHDFDHVIAIGAVTFHYFAGFTGGRKLICPGLASSKTISATHRLAFDCDRKTRRDGVGTGLLDGNPVHEAFVQAASFAKPAFAVNTIVNDRGEAVEVFCGDWIESHLAACEAYAAANTIEIPERREVVVVSSGGLPYDINMIQAHKALEAASRACVDGGTIVLLAECPDGLGRSDFLSWFESENSEALAEKLCEKYQVNGQTAWTLLRKTEKFVVQVVTELEQSATSMLRMKKIEDLQQTIDQAESGYLLTNGAGSLITVAR